MKKVLVILATLAVIGIGFFVWFSLGTTGINNGVNNIAIQGTSSSLPVVPAASSTIPLGGAIFIGTSQGIVTVNNFYKNIIGQDEEYDILEQSAGYDLLYNTEDSSFVISIKKGVLAQIRPQAEQAFLNMLGISTGDACKLTVVVGVDAAGDPSLANQALSLSFCAASTFSQ